MCIRDRTEVDRVLTNDGLYVMNVIDRGGLDFVRAEVATLVEVFPSVQIIVPPADASGRGSSNFLIVGSRSQIPRLVVPAEDGIVLTESETIDFFGDAEPLRDDFAPVDQLLD